jgi:hypothetical protein
MLLRLDWDKHTGQGKVLTWHNAGRHCMEFCLAHAMSRHRFGAVEKNWHIMYVKIGKSSNGGPRNGRKSGGDVTFGGEVPSAAR